MRCPHTPRAPHPYAQVYGAVPKLGPQFTQDMHAISLINEDSLMGNKGELAALQSFAKVSPPPRAYLTAPRHINLCLALRILAWLTLPCLILPHLTSLCLSLTSPCRTLPRSGFGHPDAHLRHQPRRVGPRGPSSVNFCAGAH